MRIFSKIETIRPCDTPNLSTKFHPNPSTTFWDIVLYISFAQSFNGEESLKKIIGSLYQNVISSSLSRTQCVLQASSESVPNFLRYCAIYRFWPRPSAVKNYLKNSWMRIQIFTKIESISPCHTPNMTTKFSPNPSTTFKDILFTNRQTGVKT